MSAVGLLVFRNRAREDRGLLAMMMPAFNMGLFAYPLVEGVLGRQALLYLSMMDIGNAVVGFAGNYLIGACFSPKHAGISFRKIIVMAITTIPLVMYILTLVIAMTGQHYPSMVVEASHLIAKANMPLALLVLGIFLSFQFEARHWGDIIKILAMRYALGIIAGVALYHFLPFNHLFLVVVLVSMLMPPPMMTIPFGVEFDYDLKFIGTTLNFGNVTSYVLLYATFLALSRFAH
jgi:predicted permease